MLACCLLFLISVQVVCFFLCQSDVCVTDFVAVVRSLLRTPLYVFLLTRINIHFC